MNFYRKKNLQYKKPSNQLFWSQELNHRRNNEIEKQSSINSSEILNYHDKFIKKDSILTLNDNLKNNLAQNKNKNNPIQINKDFINFDNGNDKINSNINNEKRNNNELDNEWNDSNINFDNISVVSKVNSNDNNNEQSNIIDNNLLFKCDNINNDNNYKENNKEENAIEKLENINKNNDKNIKSSFISNSCENFYFEEKIENEVKNDDKINSLKKEKELLEEKLKNEQNINREKTYHIEILKKALNDNILNTNNNKGNKNLLNLGIVLEYSKSKLENEKLKKNIIIQQILCDDMKKELESVKKEKDKLIEKKNTYIEKIRQLEEYEIKMKENLKSEQHLKDELNKQKIICFNLQKELNNLNQKNSELLELNEKLRKDKRVINSEEKNFDFENIIKEKNNQINELKLENLNLIKKIEIANVNGKQNEIMNKDIYIILNDSYKNIEDISKKIKIYIENVKENKTPNDIIFIKILKDYIAIINPDINGNISLQDKLKIIKEFTNIIKIKLDVLLNHFEIFQKNNFNFERIKIEENEKNNFLSSNGQSNDNDNKDIVKNNKINYNNNNFLKSNNLFKKIDLLQYKSKLKTNENNKENNDFISNKLLDSKIKLIDKRRIVFKSHLSEISKTPIDSINNNTNTRIKNNKIDDLFSDIFKEKIKKKKNIINLKTKEINDIISTKNHTAIKSEKNSFIRIPKRYNINIYDDLSKINNTNIFPSNKKIINLNERNDIILSLNNTSRKTMENKIDKEENLLYGKNLKEKTNSNFERKKIPLMILNNSNDYKKNLNFENTYINNKDNYTLENDRIIENYNKKKIWKNRSNISLEKLQKELYSNTKTSINKDHDINDLAEEIMKPSFLKGNNTFSINNKKEKKIIKIKSFKNIKNKNYCISNPQSPIP